MSVKIALIVEGKTERAFMPILRNYLERHLAGAMPKIKTISPDGRIPKGEKLKKMVKLLLDKHDHVIALTDVYTGTSDFANAEEAIQKMRQWIGPEKRFHPHAAQHDFEAWLIPYWDRIQRIAKSDVPAPPGAPESVNHDNPPSKRIIQAFQRGELRKDYKKTVDAANILKDQDLQVAINQCPCLKALVNTILHTICGKPPLG